MVDPPTLLRNHRAGTAVPDSGGQTTLLIAHRLQTTRIAQRVLVLDRGQVIEDGTHEQLLADGGVYAHLWRTAGGLDQVETELPTLVRSS